MDEYTNCLNCKFFLFFDEDEELDEIYGHCRRFPPVQKNENAALRGCYGSEPLAHSNREWSQPVVEADDWCGEFSQSNAVGICELMNFAAEFIAAAPAIHEGGEHA